MEIDASLVSTGQTAAGAAIAFAVAGFFLRKDRGRLSDIASWTTPRLPLLTADRTILWFAAGEAAGVAPAIVASSLYRNVLVGRAPELDSAVARVLQDAKLTELMPLAGASFPGEPGSRSAARIARFAAMVSPRERDPWRWLSYLAMALVVAGACCVSMAVYAGIGQLGGQV
jgi:hypothetical protein